MKPKTFLICLSVAGLLFSCAVAMAQQAKFSVPVEYYKLKNGLKVVLSKDTTAPTVVIAVYYNIGFRVEPKDRTGFAHLFEHMMFQGSANLGKAEFIRLVQSNGGVLNGSTRFDFTNYYEVLPSHKLETALWAEADRMKGLDITQANLTNQQGVVENEVKVNVLNQPYGGFPWLTMPQYANSNWYNAHNFYGDLQHLEAATLEDVKNFFKTYYAPNNAVLVVTGDFESADAKKWIDQYFSAIPSAKVPPFPNLDEAQQTKEKKSVLKDKLIDKPALAFAYHMPKRNTPEYYAMGLLDQLLIQGSDSKLYEVLVQKKGYTGQLSGGINYLGNMFDYNGPMLWMGDLIYDESVSADAIMTDVDQVITNLQKGVSQDELNLALVKLRSQLYNTMNDEFGVGRADLFACFALFDDNPNRINTLEQDFRKVTPELMQKTAEQYLQPSNRTVLILQPEKGGQQ
jgi:zinc protease